VAVPEGRIPGIGRLSRRDKLLPFGHVMDIVNRVASPFKKTGCQDAGQVGGAHGVHQCIHFPGEMTSQGRVAAADHLHGCTRADRRLAKIGTDLPVQCGCRGTREAAGIGEDEKPGTCILQFRFQSRYRPGGQHRYAVYGLGASGIVVQDHQFGCRRSYFPADGRKGIFWPGGRQGREEPGSGGRCVHCFISVRKCCSR
jgi:hypothetical protein